MKHLLAVAVGAAVGFVLTARALKFVEARIRDTDIDLAWEWASEDWS